jgi:hypothetical protein
MIQTTFILKITYYYLFLIINSWHFIDLWKHLHISTFTSDNFISFTILYKYFLRLSIQFWFFFRMVDWRVLAWITTVNKATAWFYNSNNSSLTDWHIYECILYFVVYKGHTHIFRLDKLIWYRWSNGFCLLDLYFSALLTRKGSFFLWYV